MQLYAVSCNSINIERQHGLPVKADITRIESVQLLDGCVAGFRSGKLDATHFPMLWTEGIPADVP